jgi:GNAT superfamily N-acetyltransferase
MDRLAELAGYDQSFPGMVDEDFIAAGFSPDEVYSYRINQQAQSETARARELASMQEQRRARGQALAAQYPDYFRQGLETEPLYGIGQRMSDIKAGAELTQDPNFARRQFARLATGLGLPLSLAESALGLAELTPYGSFASGFDVAASIPQTAEYLREGEYGRAALSGAGGFLAALDVIGASLPITVPAALAVSKIDTGKLAAGVVGTGRALVDMDLEFLLGRGDPALAQGVGADVPGRPPLTFDEVEAAMKAEAPAKPTAAELRRQANIQRFGYDPSEVVERTPTDDAGFEAYLEKVNPGMKRIAEEARPNLMMGDMYGMMPKGSEVVGSKGNVTFHRSPNGEYYATAFNPDVNEEDVIGYITDRGDGTELAVVSEMQGQGVGGELQYLFRKENPNAPTGGLTEAGEGSLRRTYKRLADEGIIGGDVGFDVVRKDASSIFGEGSERVRYTDPKTGGTIEVVARSDGSASVLELEVPEDFQGQGVGQKLQQQVMEDFPMMGGQVSSKAAATTAYRLGRRPPGKPNATLDEVFAEIDEMSSVNMVSPDMQTRFGGPTAPQGIKAYQGSPHNFAAERLVRYPDGSTEYIVGSPDVLPDIPAGAEVLEDFPLGRMRMDKIGTGEGAQAYGHGIYSAEAEGVAKVYRDQLSNMDTAAAQRVLDRFDGDVNKAILDTHGKFDRLEERFKTGAFEGSEKRYYDQRQIQYNKIMQLEQFAETGQFPTGSMYEINIDANPDDFLDWDAPLSAQPAARKLGIPSQVELDDLTSEIRALEARGANASDADMTTLEGFFNAPWKNPELHEEWAAKIEARNQMLRAQDTYGGDVPSLVRASNYTPGLPGTRDGVAKHLMERGIPGIKYLDQGSRNTSGGEILGVQKTADGWTAKIRVDDRGGTVFQTPAQSVTTKKGFATEAEAMDWAKGKVSSGSRNFVVFDEKLISIVKKYGIAGAATMLGVSALDVEQALADNLAPSDWEDLVAGPVVETVSSIKEKYPLFSDIEVRDLRDQGVQDGRRLEFTEAYDDRYDKPLIEIFDPALQGEELEQAIIGEFLHEAPRRIPEYAKLREKLQKLKTPQQLQDDMNSYLYDVENYGENRPFEKWDEVSRKDAFIRGHAVGQWEPEYYTDEQKTLIDEMMGLIRSGANK